MRAGLLDRAETLFSDLVGIDVRAASALRHLISIYQQERDWNKAIDHARRLEAATGESQGRLTRSTGANWPSTRAAGATSMVPDAIWRKPSPASRTACAA